MKLSDADPRFCAECGSDTYFAKHFERVRDKATSMENLYKREVAAHALTKAQHAIEEADRKTNQSFLQAKIERQRKAIRKLEAKVRNMGQKPYEPEPETP